MANQKEQINDKQNLTRNVIKDILRVGLVLVLGIIILFISAGRINWEYAWIYTIIAVLLSLIGAKIVPPEVLAERGRKKENVEKWDSIITGLVFIPWFAQYLVSGLDARFGWSPELATSLHIAAIVIYISGEALQIWSMRANMYFSSSVRIQYDRGQTVSTGGPYRYIRHPGYVGMMIYYLATPIILGSIWALIPASAIVSLLIIRTVLEDQTLKNKLNGYKGYADKVKYKLLPGVW
jgi:protein-S-isoprenylcysteine O-methyltransferase Ste14